MVPGNAIVETDRARTKGCDLKQAPRHHDVLEEVDHLILVGEVAVERHTRDHREYDAVLLLELAPQSTGARGPLRTGRNPKGTPRLPSCCNASPKAR